MNPFFKGLSALGYGLMWLVILAGILLLLLFALARFFLWLHGRQKEQITTRGDQYAGSEYRMVQRTPARAAWRRHLRRIDALLAPEGFHRFIHFNNSTSEQLGRPNDHINFLGPDGGTLFCLTFMTLERADPWLGLHLPLPAVTGHRITGWGCETLFADKRLLLTMEADPADDCRWPDNYDVNVVPSGTSTLEALHHHLAEVRKRTEAGAVIHRWNDPGQYMQHHHEQHTALGRMMREDFAKLVEKMDRDLEQCADSDPDAS